ncbi:MAG: hypothetical protein C4554_10050 [Dethiobacter sp.]|jgi:hypothetical protein|nr:MAG: hypothetical protein C4554_10050 [Dethiobacter sp.]
MQKITLTSDSFFKYINSSSEKFFLLCISFFSQQLLSFLPEVNLLDLLLKGIWGYKAKYTKVENFKLVYFFPL